MHIHIPYSVRSAWCIKMALQKTDQNELKTDEDLKPVAEGVAFRELLSYADGLDWTLMVLGTLGSTIHGLAQPVGYMLLGKALDAFGENINNDEAMVKALKKVHKLCQEIK